MIAETGVAGTVLVGDGVLKFRAGAPLLGFAGVFVALGYAALKSSWREWTDLRTPSASPRDALLAHVVGMLGAYTAAVTAFVAVNFHTESFPPVLVWLMPPAIGGFMIRWWKRRLAVGNPNVSTK